MPFILKRTVTSKLLPSTFPHKLKRDFFLSLEKYTFPPSIQWLIFTFIQTWNSTGSRFAYPTGNMKHKENPLFKTSGYKPVRDEICISILVKNPVHIRTDTHLHAPTSVLIQGWVQSSLEHLQGQRSHIFSGHLFQYFTTLKVIFFSLYPIRICYIPACVWCISFFHYPSLRRVRLCLTAVKCNCENVGLLTVTAEIANTAQ